MPSNDFRSVHAPIAGRSTWVSRWTRAQRVLDHIGNFLIGGVPGFLGGLTTGSIAVALLIGIGVGAVYMLLRMRFGSRMDSTLHLSPQQVEARARARANGYMGPGLG